MERSEPRAHSPSRMLVLEKKVSEIESTIERIENDLSDSVEELVADTLKNKGIEEKLTAVLSAVERLTATVASVERRLRWVEDRIEKRGRPAKKPSAKEPQK